MFKTSHLTVLEIIVLIFITTLVCTGIIIARIDISLFEEVYVAEDGFVENWTVLVMLVAAMYALYNYGTLRKAKTFHFKLTMIMIALFSLFIAGEEISWGQRIFGVESSEFFKANNGQGETNLHNLIVGGVKVNKIVFSQLLILVTSFYLILLPILYEKNGKIREIVDRFGLPIARLYQVVGCLVLFASILLIPSGKNAEILEVGITTLFLLIFLFPKNKHVFLREDRY
ncbi:MAG: hypothetical protein ACTIJ8_14440 [Sphingobacterium sp.]